MRVIVEDDGGSITITKATPAGQESESSSWDGSSVAARLVKAAPERRYTLHVAYPADKPDKNIAADGFRDFASKEAVEEAAWAYMVKHRRIGAWHAEGTDGAGTPCESYIYRGPDWTIKAPDGSEHVVKDGDWMLGVIWDEAVWPKVLSGEIGGVSMQGSATRRKPSRESLARLRS